MGLAGLVGQRSNNDVERAVYVCISRSSALKIRHSGLSMRFVAQYNPVCTFSLTNLLTIWELAQWPTVNFELELPIMTRHNGQLNRNHMVLTVYGTVPATVLY